MAWKRSGVQFSLAPQTRTPLPQRGFRRFRSPELRALKAADSRGDSRRTVFEQLYASSMAWRPLSKRNDPERAVEYDALHEGVPEWLAGPAARWVFDVFRAIPYSDNVDQTLDLLSGALRKPLPTGVNWQDKAITFLGNEVANGDLDVLDAVVWVTDLHDAYGWRQRDHLEVLLHSHGSAWTIGKDEDGRPCLERRVDETTTAAAKAEMDQGGNAPTHLRRAWHRVYGRNPDAGGAYREAVRAVEAAAKPVITPNDRVATLGKMIIAMEAKPSKWHVVLDGNGRGSGLAHVVGNCKALWTSQLDRHGTDDETVRLDVSAEEAEAALHLATTLVHWFRTGAVQPAHTT